MGRPQFLVLSLFLPVLISFNNCGRSSGDTFGSDVNLSVSPNGGALSRGDFEFFSPTPLCDRERGAPAAVLSVNGESSELYNSGCAAASEFDVDSQALGYRSHNSHMVYFDGKIFASPYLHQGVDGHIYYKEFCFDENQQFEFTIQYISTVVPGLTQPLEQFVGISMKGPEMPIPGIQFNGGYFEERLDGSKHFQAMNGAFDFYLDKADSQGAKKAIYQDSGGNQYVMSCWHHNP